MAGAVKDLFFQYVLAGQSRQGEFSLPGRR
jgi:hypothetical protein